MRVPAIKATIQRRVLVNYRVDPEALAAVVPPPFRPVLVGGYGVAGICLIRLGDVRPAGVPAALGVMTENAAHRIAVEWDTADGPVKGVYIPRRDTSSRLSALLGGRLFPGWQHRARFRVEEGGGSYRIELSSRDGEVAVAVAAHRAEDVMAGSIFRTVEEASAFFRCAPIGYAATPTPGVFDGVTLAAEGWAIEPLHVKWCGPASLTMRSASLRGRPCPTARSSWPTWTPPGVLSRRSRPRGRRAEGPIRT